MEEIEITDEMRVAFARALYNEEDINEMSCHPSTFEALEAVAPLIARAAYERAAQVAYNFPHYAAFGDDPDENWLMRPGSPYDRGRYDAARAIRALGK
jgi:hypothetical protein